MADVKSCKVMTDHFEGIDKLVKEAPHTDGAPNFRRVRTCMIGQNFDLIIDDGLHAPYTNLNFIITSINKLKKGGWLIIEDIPFRAQSIWEIISFIVSLKYKPFLIRSRNGLMLLVNKKKN